MSLRNRLEVLSQGTQDIPPDVLRDEWQEAITRLYDTIEKFFSEYVSQNLLSMERGYTVAIEERLGTYQVLQLHMMSGPEKITLTPRARLVAGATGRVDAYNQRRPETGYILLRQKMRADELWTINSRTMTNRLLAEFRPTLLSDIGAIETSVVLDKNSFEGMLETMLPQ